MKPSNTLYIICCHARALYVELARNDENKSKLLACTNHRKTFVELWSRKLENNYETQQIINTKCDSNHAIKSYISSIGEIMFNLFAKNLIADENTKIQATRKRGYTAKTPAARKLKKLTSNC